MPSYSGKVFPDPSDMLDCELGTTEFSVPLSGPIVCESFLLYGISVAVVACLATTFRIAFSDVVRRFKSRKNLKT